MISARNKIKGKVVEVKPGVVNGIVKIDAGSGVSITASITMDSINSLGLVPGKDCYAVVKASEVMVALNEVRLSARNQIKGKITEIEKGAVSAVVKIDGPADIKLCSVITMDSVTALNLNAGNEVVAVVKASSVMVSVD